MPEVEIKDLEPGKRLKQSLYNEKGLVICRAGEVLADRHLTLLRATGSRVAFLGQPDQSKERDGISLDPINVEDIELEAELKADIHDESGRVVLRRGEIFTRLERDLFLRAGRTQFYAYPEAIRNGALPDPKKSKNNLQEIFNPKLSPNWQLKVKANKTAVRIRAQRKLRRSEAERRSALTLMKNVANQASTYMTDLKRGKTIDINPIRKLTDASLEMIYNDFNLFALLVSRTPTVLENQYDMRELHLTATFFAAMSIGTYMDFDEDQMYELGASALLHDVGMLRVRQELVNKPQPLQPHELMEIHAHPMHSVNMLENAIGISRDVLLAIYQSHERVSGQGYPHKKHGNGIHDFAKAVAVADTYCALIEKRPYRVSLTPYEAMEKVLHQASAKFLDPRAVRALLQGLGLFPVGSWVETNTGHIARVVGLRHNAPRFDKPVINLIFDSENERLENAVLADLLDETQVSISSALRSKEYETDWLLGM